MLPPPVAVAVPDDPGEAILRAREVSRAKWRAWYAQTLRDHILLESARLKSMMLDNPAHPVQFELKFTTISLSSWWEWFSREPGRIELPVFEPILFMAAVAETCPSRFSYAVPAFGCNTQGISQFSVMYKLKEEKAVYHT